VRLAARRRHESGEACNANKLALTSPLFAHRLTRTRTCTGFRSWLF
jgi:hypothetical protein